MNTEIKIGITKTADMEQLRNLYKEAGWWNDEENAPDLVNKIVQGSFCFAVASADDRLIGMGRVISDGASDAYIQDVMVSNEFRGKGLGVLIIDELVKYLKSKNINWIALISEPKAVSFYQRYGFSQMTDYVPFILK